MLKKFLMSEIDIILFSLCHGSLKKIYPGFLAHYHKTCFTDLRQSNLTFVDADYGKFFEGDYGTE